MDYVITKEERQPQAVLVARRQVSHTEVGATIGEVLSKLFHYAQEQGIAVTGKPFTRYVDVGAGLMTIEPGMRVALPEHESAGEPSDDDAGAVRPDRLQGGLIASTIHTGPYETLREAFAAVEAWIESEGLTPAGPPWESYITDPTENTDPQTWQTEICWPVK